MKTLFLIDAITRANSEDPVYLDKPETLARGHIYFSLGKPRELINNKHISRIIGICYWKFINGFYFTKPWDNFLGIPIASDGALFIKDSCPDTNCSAIILRNPKEIKLFCPQCNRHYSKPVLNHLNLATFHKSTARLRRTPFCHSCGKDHPYWKNNESLYLCTKCFPKYGDVSFSPILTPENGTKLKFPAAIILSAGRSQSHE